MHERGGSKDVPLSNMSLNGTDRKKSLYNCRDTDKSMCSQTSRRSKNLRGRNESALNRVGHSFIHSLSRSPKKREEITLGSIPRLSKINALSQERYNER